MKIIISGPWGTLASVFFFLAALLGGDLLALRLCLFLAYVFLLINGVTGLPAWPWAASYESISVDMICWAVAAGVLHGCAVVRMLLDELPVRYGTEDDRQVATFFSRRSGMEPLEAKNVLKHGCWLRVPAGHRIVNSVQLYECVYLLVEGCCAYASPCCPSSPGSPAVCSRTTSHKMPSPQPSPKQPMPHLVHHAAIKLGEQQQQQQQQQQEVSSGMYVEDISLSLTKMISLDNVPVLRQPHGCWLEPNLAPIQSGVAADTSTGGMNKSTSPFAAAAATGASCAPHMLPWHPAGRGKHQHMRSGNIFSLSALNVFGVYIGFDQFHGSQLEVWAETDCLLYCWSMSSLEKMATACSPALAAYWRNFITYSIASEFEMRAHKRMALSRCSTGDLEHESWLQGGRSRDFTDAPRDYECTGWTWERCSRWMRKTLSPFPPAGIRHTALPLTGVMARTRAMAVAEAKAQAARSRDISIRMGMPPV